MTQVRLSVGEADQDIPVDHLQAAMGRSGDMWAKKFQTDPLLALVILIANELLELSHISDRIMQR